MCIYVCMCDTGVVGGMVTLVAVLMVNYGISNTVVLEIP